MKCQTCSTSDFACFANRANWLRQHLPRVGSGQPAGHGRPGQFARGGVLGCKRGAGGSRGRHVEGRGGGLGGSSGEKIGETAAKPGTPQLPRTIQRCCPNISRSLQMTFAWLTVRVLDNVAVPTPNVHNNGKRLTTSWDTKLKLRSETCKMIIFVKRGMAKYFHLIFTQKL